jgi:hypothetical protein
MAPDDFSDKLGLVLKALSLSRGRLAAELGVAKPLVSRWVSGINTPAGHNLSLLTDLIARRRPGFSLLDWDRDLGALAALFGYSPAPEPVIAASGVLLEASRAQSRIEVDREGDAYPGIYAGFRQVFRNTGEIVADLMVIWRSGDRLRFRQFDPVFSHTGEVLILRHQLFILGEDDRRVDGLVTYILNGVTGRKAIRIDGLVMTVHGDRFRTPGAAVVIFHRLADLADDGAAPSDAVLTPMLQRLHAAFTAGEVRTLAAAAVVEAISPKVGVALADGSIDHTLRRPDERTLSASELDWCDALEADTRRLRGAVLGLDDCYPVFGPPDAAAHHRA